MKTTLLVSLLTLSTLSAFAQGTVNLNNNLGGCVRAKIYAPEPSAPGLAKIGNTSAGYPVGTQTYNGAALSGVSYYAQLFGAAGLNQPESALLPATPITTFSSGASAGYMLPGTATLTGVAADAPAATVQLRVWAFAGTYANWAAAEPAWLSGLIAAGKSPLLNVTSLGGGINPPAGLCGLQSFNIYYLAPPVPTGLAAVGGNAQVALSWNGALGATSYYVKRSTVNGGPYTLTNSVTTTSYTDTAVVNGTPYYYVVSAVNAFVESANSTQVSATPMGQPPAITLQTITLITATNAGFRASVNPNGSATTGYFQWGLTTGYGSSTPTSDLGAGTSSVLFSNLLSGLLPATLYHFRTVALNSGGTSYGSDVAFATLSTNASLSALTLSAGTLSPSFTSANTSYTASVPHTVTSLTLTPTSADSSAVIQVRVNDGTYANVVSGTASAPLAVSAGANPIDVRVTASDGVTIKTYTVTVTVLPSNGTVNFNNFTACVKAPVYGPETNNPGLSKTGNTSAGIPVGTQTYIGAPASGSSYSAQLFAAPGANMAESLLVAGPALNTFHSGSSAGFVWPLGPVPLTGVPLDAPVATVQLRVWDSSLGDWTSAQNAWLAGAIAAGKSLTFNVTNLGGAINQAPDLCGLQSFNVYFLTPPVPTGLTATAGNAQVTLGWNSSSGANTYNLKRATVSGGPYTVTNSVAGTNYTDTAVVNGTMYYYVVSAVNAFGESTNSAQISGMPLAPVTSPSITLQTTASITATSAGLQASVNPNGAATTAYFQWGLATNYGNTTSITNIGSGTSMVAVSNQVASLLPTTIYHFRTVAFNSVGTNYGSDAAFATLGTNANLSALSLSAGTLAPVFNAATTSYAASVLLAVSSLTVTPTHADTDASIQVRINGGTYAPVVSGSASGPLALNQGTNTIEVQVTAQDAAFTRTYVVSVNRSGTPPTVVTLTASDVTPTSATLRGTVNPNGSATTGWFEWGTNSSYGYTTPAVNLGSGSTDTPMSAPIAGLTPGAFYQFRLVASNATAVSYGAAQQLAGLIAYDDARPYPSWAGGTNFGYGFGPWILQQTPNGGGNYAGFFLGNAGDAVASTNGNAWGLYANGSGKTNMAVAYRGFNSPLAQDTCFTIKWHTKGIGLAINQMAGFSLRTGNTSSSASDYDAGSRFDFYYQGGGNDGFRIRDFNGATSIAVSFAQNPLQIEFTLLTNDTYRLRIKDASGVNTLSDSYSTLAGTGSIDSVALYALQTDGDQVFNNLQISSVSLLPPEISDLWPADGTPFVPATTKLGFFVTSAFSTVPTNNITLVLNGVTQTNLTFGIDGIYRTVLLNSNLPDNAVVNGMITVFDANGNQATKAFSFNTWRSDNPFVEAEDYNYSGGGWWDNFTNRQPNQLYANYLGATGVDYQQFDTGGTNAYRSGDLPQIELSGDVFDHAGFSAASLQDYALAYNAYGEWTDYTRRLGSTTYAVYARMSGFGANPVMLFERLGAPTVNSTDQPRAALGTFVCPSNTGGVQSYTLVPLRDFFSNPVRVHLPSTNTFRCTVVGTGNSYNFSYLTFVPSDNTNKVRPYLSAGFPFPGAQPIAADPLLWFTIANAQTAVLPATIQLFLNGNNVTSGLSLSNTAAGTVVSYQPVSMVPLGSINTLQVIFGDGEVTQTNQWQFTLTDAPRILAASAAFGVSDPVSGTAPVTFNGTVTPGRLDTAAAFQFGLTPSFGGSSATYFLGAGSTGVPFTTVAYGFIPSRTYYYRVVATNQSGITFGPNQTLVGTTAVPGDVNYDGIVDQNELDAVLANYWPHSPWLYMTNTIGLGGGEVTFALTNSTAGAYSVEFSTNLADWLYLGPATPRYGFMDTNAPASPQRYYRLRWP